MDTITTHPLAHGWNQRHLAALILVVGMVLTIPHGMRAAQGDTEPTPLGSASDTVRGVLWSDITCDGVRQIDEPAMTGNPQGGQLMSLFYIGNDGVPFTSDDAEIGLGSALNGSTSYSFRDGGGSHTYYIALRPSQRPSGFVPAPFQQGSDRTIDNDLTIWPNGAWATSTFVIAQGTGFFNGPPAVTGIDIGLCPLASISRPYRVFLPLISY